MSEPRASLSSQTAAFQQRFRSMSCLCLCMCVCQAAAPAATMCDHSCQPCAGLSLSWHACVQAAAAANFKPTPATGWWGARMFSSAGLLEGMDQEQQQRERGFDEDLQTKVYMDAHNAQRQGKKGLGKSSTLKIAGGCGVVPAGWGGWQHVVLQRLYTWQGSCGRGQHTPWAANTHSGICILFLLRCWLTP